MRRQIPTGASARCAWPFDPKLAGLFLLALAIPAAWGCSDHHPTRAGTAMLAGTVVDSSGTGVAGAPVLVAFDLVPAAPGAIASGRATGAGNAVVADCPGCVPGTRYLSLRNNPFVSGGLVLQFAIPDTAFVSITIGDRAGTVVRRLAERSFVAGEHALFWDGRDDRNEVVPNGLYLASWTDDEGDSVFHETAAILRDATNPSASHQALTDGRGRFTIPIGDLPIGAAITGVDATGTVTGNFIVSSNVTVWSCRAPGDDAGSNSVAVSLGNLARTVSVVVPLRLP